MPQQRPIPIELEGETEPSDPLARAEYRLERRLRQAGVVSADEMKEARGRQKAAGGRLSTALWELGLADEVLLRGLGAEFFGVPPALPQDVASASEEVTRVLGHEFVERHRVIPFARNRETLLVATAEPWRLPLLDSIGSRVGCRVEPRFLDEAPLGRLLGTLYGLAIDPRLQKEPRKRRVPASSDPGLRPTPPGQSAFGSSSNLMSETTFEEIYRRPESTGPTVESPTPEPTVESPKAEPPPEQPAPAATKRARFTPPPEAATTRAEVIDLLEAIHTWDPRYDTSRATPLALEEARAALANAADPHQLGWVLARHGLALGRRVALLFQRGGVWMGWTGAGEGVSAPAVAALMVPPQDGTIFGVVQQSRAPWAGPLASHPIHERFHLVLGGGELPRTAALVPVCQGERLLLGIYLDGGPGGALPENLWSIASLASEVPRALERLVSTS